MEAAGERRAKHTGTREKKEGTVEKVLCSCKECRRRAAPERTTASMDPLHPPCVAEELSTHGRQCAMPLLPAMCHAIASGMMRALQRLPWQPQMSSWAAHGALARTHAHVFILVSSLVRSLCLPASLSFSFSFSLSPPLSFSLSDWVAA